MKRVMKAGFVFALIALAGWAILAKVKQASAKEPLYKTVEVEQGHILDKALAVGQVVPDKEIQVKSQISGLVRTCFVKVGDTVKVGDPLVDISPDPTPLELTEKRRNVQLARVSFDKAKADLKRTKPLYEQGILPQGDYDNMVQAHDRTRAEYYLANERLALARDGHLGKNGKGADSIIRSQAAGTILQRLVNEGDPVVPLTTFQAGTALMVTADMSQLLFKGTVDEIDVGKLDVGQKVRITIGALPDAQITGTLTHIAPKGHEKEGATLFAVEAIIDEENAIALRAGYSANAEIVVQEKDEVPVVPERLLIFEDDKIFVEVATKDADAEPKKREITIGLSDGLQVEVVTGLELGELVVERPAKVVS